MRTLYKGCKGADVANLQYRLGIAPDGDFGNITDKAVREAQAKMGLKVDGYVGTNTQKAFDLSDFRVHVFDANQVWFAGTPYNITPKPIRTLKQWATLERCDYVFNHVFFTMDGTGKTVTYLKAKGYDVGYGGIPERITVDANNICGGAKLAVLDNRKQSVSYMGKRPRNANGILTDGRYFQIQSVTACTESAMVDYILSKYSVKIMMIQDGGGSTGFYDNTRGVLLAAEPEGKDGRPVASVVCVTLNVVPQKKICPTCGQEIK